jgi:hypothetical protein
MFTRLILVTTLALLGSTRLENAWNGVSNRGDLTGVLNGLAAESSASADLTPRVEPILKLELGMSQRQPASFAEA